jgi:PAS domain S-box-containing protein
MFSSVFAGSPVPTLITRTRDGTVVAANPACLALLGWREDEFVGRRVRDLGFWRHSVARESLMGTLLGEGEVEQIDVLTTRAGEDRQVIISALLVDIDGEQCSMGLFHDVTERELLRGRLQRSEETLRSFLDFAPALISVRDLEGHLLLHNRAMAERFTAPEGGADPFAVPADGIFPTGKDSNPMTAATWVSTLADQVVSSGEAVRAERELVEPDGSRAVYEFVKFPIRSSSGEIYAVGTISLDVTTDRTANAELRETQRRFRQMAEAMDEVFLLWQEGSQEILYVSPAVERVLGLDAERFGDPATRLGMVHPDDRDLFLSPPLPLKEFRITKPGGEIRWIRARSHVANTVDGEVVRWATTMVDITVQKAAGEAIRSARLEADRANQAKTEFLSRMSHELRTPLNAILGFGQLLASDERLDEDHRQQVDQITRAGGHLLDLINELLDLSRIESGHLNVSLESLHLADVAEDALGLIEPIAAAAGVKIHRELGVGTECVLADRQRLTQVILNLVTNAVKYNRQHGQVTVSCPASASGSRRFRVADTGPGIAPDDLGRIFLPFERLGADQGPVEGTGLGLAHSKQLIEAMNGTIGVDSELGVGSTFWFDLPAAAAPDPSTRRDEPVTRVRPPRTAAIPVAVVSADATTAQIDRLLDQGAIEYLTKPFARDRLLELIDRSDALTPLGPPEDAAPDPPGRAVVVYVEDDRSNQVLMTQLFEREFGHLELVVVDRGADCLPTALARRPSLILVDGVLTDMTGAEVIRALQSESSTRDIPIVMVSGLPRAVSEAPSSIRGYLDKPIDLAELRRLVAHLIVDPDGPASS